MYPRHVKDSPEGQQTSPFRGYARAAESSMAIVETVPSEFRAEASSTVILQAEEMMRGRHGAQLKGLEPRLTQRLNTPEEYTSRCHHMATSTSGLEGCLLSNNEAELDPTPVLGCGRYPTQWRPQNQNTNQDMALVLNETLGKLANMLQPAQPRHKAVAPKFEGAEWENPREFLHAIERYCRQENYHQDEWTLVTADQLRGEAYKWFEVYRQFHLSFEDFRGKLLERYDSIAVRSRLQAKLYGQRQGREDVAVFITQKMALYRRLVPELSENLMVQQIRELLAPEIRMALRGSNIYSINQLTQIASSIEMDLQEINRKPENFASTAMVSSNTTRATGTPLVRSKNPPYPCKYCQGNHYNSDCLRRRAIEPSNARDINQGPSTSAAAAENSRRAALPSTQTPRPLSQ